ncbi:MAG: glycosyltransferase family 2 protein [Thermoplasmata archaeon]|jgi:glycosyltransferase involved in cell wall biosynthesis|nr:glycosyltransferase family 2 protein [Thermoplasmata archaeon]
MRASLVIPTLNESGSIALVLRTFRTAADAANRAEFASDPIDWEILVVDGASTDGTGEIAAREGARVIVERRRGYGRAYKTGFAASSGEVITTADGDGTYPVDLIPHFVRQLLDQQIDLLSGNRMAYLDRRAMTTEHRIGNRLLNILLRVLYHHYLHDMPERTLLDSQSGYWVFRRSVLDRVALTQDGMAFSEEFKIEAFLRGLKVVEVPIHYGERWGSPKLSTWRDGLSNMVFLVSKRLAVQRELKLGAPTPFRRDVEAGAPRA